MGLLSKAIGAMIIGATAKKINTVSKETKRRHEEIVQKEKERKRTPFLFDDGISEMEFRVLVRREAKKIKRIKSVEFNGPIVKGKVISQSGISEWSFRIDLNDYGHFSNRYWISSNNDDSNIPKIFAQRIIDSINIFPNNIYPNFYDEVENEKKKEKERIKTECPYCGERIYEIGLSQCPKCKIKFSVRNN